MANVARDRIVGAVLILAAALWCWATVATIPAAEDATRLGSRGFPLGLGVMLGVLGLVVLLMSGRETDQARDADDGARQVPLSAELWSIAMTLMLIVGYAVAMELTGFLIATVLVIVVAVLLVLGLMRPMLILGLSLGMAAGIYLVFGKLLGVYLPHGQWVDLAF